jgi:O-antigen ligase
MTHSTQPLAPWYEEAVAADWPSSGERVFAVLALAYFAKAMAPFAAGFQVAGYSMEGAVHGNPVDQVIGSTIYVISILLLLRKHQVVQAALASPLLGAFIILATASALWSVVPEITLRRAVGLLGTASFGAYLACRFAPRDVLRMIAAAFAIVTGLSILVIIFVPSFGLAEGGETAGVYGHKNELGRAMVFAVLATSALSLDPEVRRPIWAIPALAAAFTLLLLSRSAQAYVGLAAAVAFVTPLLMVCARLFRKVQFRMAIMLLSMTALVAFIVSTLAEELLDLLGRDETLTDRTVIWEIIAELAREQPWLGRGYGGFWFSDVYLWFADRWGAIDHAHNGYMDLWLELGYVGVAAFVILLLAASKTAWNAYLMHPTVAHGFFATFIAIAALINCVGRLVPAHNSIYWVVLCYCAIMHLSVRRSRLDLPVRYWTPSRPTSMKTSR